MRPLPTAGTPERTAFENTSPDGSPGKARDEGRPGGRAPSLVPLRRPRAI